MAQGSCNASDELMRTAFCIAFLFGSSLLPAGTAGQPRTQDDRYDRIEIVQPEDQSTVFDNNGHVDVLIRVLPSGELAPGDRIMLFIDNNPLPPQGQAQALDHVERGTHLLMARIINSHGSIVIESGPVTFYMWQAS